MDKMANYLPQNGAELIQKSDCGVSAMGSPSRRAIAELWARMGSLYGHRWASSYGTSDADDTWLHALRGVTPQQMAAGLRAAISRSKDRRRSNEEDWPPTAGEFRAMCEEPVISEFKGREAATHRSFPKLPRPQVNPGVVQSEIGRMKEILHD